MCFTLNETSECDASITHLVVFPFVYVGQLLFVPELPTAWLIKE